MTSRSKEKVVRYMIILIALITTIKLYPYVIANRGEEVFINNNPVSMLGSANDMESYIKEGAGFYLKSNSDFLQVLNRVEVAVPGGLDYIELRALTKSAISNMESAVAAYRNLKAASDAASYNPGMIDRLKGFNYYEFRVSMELNASLSRTVEKYLSTGDVKGVFSKILVDSETLSKMLQTLYVSVDAGNFPDINLLWRINKVFSETLQFGQYSAQVFYEISKQ
jgi:hypothetical protein